MAVALPGEAAIPAPERAAEQGRIGLGTFLVILVQLGLLTLVLRQFQVESSAFRDLWLLAIGGFAVHAFLPLRYRLPFFLALSLTGIALVMGVAHGAWLVAIGLVLIGICHLPLAFATRVALLLAVAAVLVGQRSRWIPAPWSEAIWPILGSMFMFRLIVYLYDLRHETKPSSAWQSLSYFFMLPNACFPLFPVVDYKTFRRNYYDDDAYRIYQIGVDWILRGVIHLILYRVVYYYFTLAPSEVHGPGDLAQYLVSNFLLYLRVSGQFHLIVGMLYLFGFRLPETHHKYFLASSFTDFWRRINIYWKDFMLKVFYYPAYFKLRRFGTTQALILSTLLVFLMTWFLHAYQWFWLRGTVLFVWQDILFWTVLGGLVVINSLYEAKHGRERTLRGSGRTWRGYSILALKTAGTFSVICVLWSFWTSESIADWLSLWTVLGEKVTADLGPSPLLLAAAMVVGRAAGGGEGPKLGQRKRPPLPPVVATVMSLAVLLSLGIERIYAHFGPTVASIIQPLRSGKLSRLDNAALERGYYENLLGINRFNSQLWEVYAKRPASWLDNEGGGTLKRHTGGFAQNDLIPSFVAATTHGTVTINRWGMRDQDYELRPPPGAFRIALLGPSNVMGWGVEDGATFEALLERRLNSERAGQPFPKYEILNFGVPGYQPPQQLVALEKALKFEPNAVFYVATGRELSRAGWYLVEVVQKRLAIPYSFLQEIVAKAGLNPDMDEATARRRLASFQPEILLGVYRHIAEECRKRGLVAVWIYLPQVREGIWQEETPEMLRIAAAAGFVIVDLADVYKNERVEAIRLAEWDQHPNSRGHQLIAARLHEALQAKRDVVFQINDQRGGKARP
jgi:D-alanyl-lipoteichoic acid acyltransferase DltB (MBOAT superfamily)